MHKSKLYGVTAMSVSVFIRTYIVNLIFENRYNALLKLESRKMKDKLTKFVRLYIAAFLPLSLLFCLIFFKIIPENGTVEVIKKILIIYAITYSYDFVFIKKKLD